MSTQIRIYKGTEIITQNGITYNIFKKRFKALLVADLVTALREKDYLIFFNDYCEYNHKEFWNIEHWFFYYNVNRPTILNPIFEEQNIYLLDKDTRIETTVIAEVRGIFATVNNGHRTWEVMSSRLTLVREVKTETLYKKCIKCQKPIDDFPKKEGVTPSPFYCTCKKK